MKHINKNTFCKIPFTQISTENNGSYYHCCYAVDTTESVINFQQVGIKNQYDQKYTIHSNLSEVWNSNFYKQLRQDLINGVKHPACNYCWNQESIGGQSYRQKNLDIGIDIDSILNEDFSLSVGPEVLDVKIGNFCNLKCIMCHPINSTEHVKEIEEWKRNNVKIPAYLNMSTEDLSLVEKSFDGEAFFQGIQSNIHSVKEIQFYGGEPLASLEVVKLLDRLIDNNYSANIKIKIITNLSILNKKVFNQLEKFKEIDMIVSWDHVDEAKANYIRYPLNYKKFLENFNLIRNNSKYKIKISNTISIFNIFDIPAIYDFFESLYIEKPLDITPSILSIPKYFNIQYLNLDQKKYLIDMLDEYILNSKSYNIFQNSSQYEMIKSLKSHLLVDNLDHNDVVKEREYVLDLYDKTRSTNTKMLYPYLYN